MRLQRFMGLHLLAKQIQSSESSFNKSLQCYKLVVWLQIPRVLCLRHAIDAIVYLCLPRKLLGHSYLMIFKCVSLKWLSL